MKLASLLCGTAVGESSLFVAVSTFPWAANADLVLDNAKTGAPILNPIQPRCTTAIPPCADSATVSFTDLGAQGFGNAPRMLTTQGSGSQNSLTGSGTPVNIANGDAVSGT